MLSNNKDSFPNNKVVFPLNMEFYNREEAVYRPNTFKRLANESASKTRDQISKFTPSVTISGQTAKENFCAEKKRKKREVCKWLDIQRKHPVMGTA